MGVVYRRFPFVVAALVVLLPVFPAVAVDGGAQRNLPANVPADWWSQVQRSIQLEEYAVVAEGTAGTEFRAANPAQRFEGRFGVDGLRLASTEGTSWEWGLSLTGWGRPGALDAAAVKWALRRRGSSRARQGCVDRMVRQPT